MRNNCIVLSQQDIVAASILDLGRMLVGEAAEERGKAHNYRAWYVTGCTLECDAKIMTEIICEFRLTSLLYRRVSQSMLLYQVRILPY